MKVLAEQLPWWWAGLYAGLLVTALQTTANLPLGATGAVVGVTSWLRPRGELGWRVFFFAGIVLGSFLHAAASGTFAPSFAHGGFDARFGDSLMTKAALLVPGGFLIGFGARWAGGCTSGHGLCGTARLSPASFVSTGTFVVTAIVVANVITHLVGGGP